jgi:cytochrome c-type biogenesis protein CcmH
MIAFWLVGGVFILIALAFVLPPLWQNETAVNEQAADSNISVFNDQLAELEADLQNGIISQEQYAQDRDEINRRVLEDFSSLKEETTATRSVSGTRNSAYVIAVALPVLAIGLYMKLGNLNARTSEPASSAQPSAASAPGGMSQAQIEANVAALAKRLESNPSDVQGWKMLARSYGILKKYDESSKAYEKAVALQPRDVDLLTNYAFALAMANGGNFEGRPKELVDQALKLEPENTNALGVAGGIAFEAKDYKKAIEYWNKALKTVPPGSDLAQAVTEKIKEAKALSEANK